MGGYGSGKKWDNMRTTAECLRLDVNRLQRLGLFKELGTFLVSWGHDEDRPSIRIRVEPCRLVLTYRYRRGGREWQEAEYAVWIDFTPCNLGGGRQWFLCPAKGCGRRVGTLYSDGIFACRLCHRLGYESQLEEPHYRALRRTRKLNLKLGGDGALCGLLPPKPKGMHWKTYRRLAARLLRAELRMDLTAAARFG